MIEYYGAVNRMRSFGDKRSSRYNQKVTMIQKGCIHI